MLKDLPTDKIHAREDAREINPANVEALAASIADIGLINPIRVRPNGDGWEVIAGRHRLEAIRSLGLVEITCDVVGDDADHAETAMIDENIIREELSPMDRARYLARRKELYGVMHPETLHTVASQKLGSPRAQRFTEKISEAIGRNESTVQLDVERGKKISDEVADMVSGTSLDSGVYLDKIKNLSPNDQYRAVERDLARERQRDRDDNARSKQAKYAANVKAKAVRDVAAMLVESFPEELMPDLKKALYEAGCAAIANELP